MEVASEEVYRLIVAERRRQDEGFVGSERRMRLESIDYVLEALEDGLGVKFSRRGRPVKLAIPIPERREPEQLSFIEEDAECLDS